MKVYNDLEEVKQECLKGTLDLSGGLSNNSLDYNSITKDWSFFWSISSHFETYNDKEITEILEGKGLLKDKNGDTSFSIHYEKITTGSIDIKAKTLEDAETIVQEGDFLSEDSFIRQTEINII